MNFIFKTCLVALLCLAAQQYLPWWSIAGAAGLVGLVFRGGGWGAFFSGFFGAGLLWLAYALYIDQQTASVLSAKVAELFRLPNPTALAGVTAMVAGLTAGFGGLTGNRLRQLVAKPKRARY
ncbi:MAG: hypothetical protein MUC97_16715 [Bernardetiaceae bacterium]|jgi:hypothetical protein|nr:hypothetical protein [Bernardetiaceae bacterium]